MAKTSTPLMVMFFPGVTRKICLSFGINPRTWGCNDNGFYSQIIDRDLFTLRKSSWSKEFNVFLTDLLCQRYDILVLLNVKKRLLIKYR